MTEYGRAAEAGKDSLSIVIRQPVGVAGIFAPWNAPVALEAGTVWINDWVSMHDEF